MSLPDTSDAAFTFPVELGKLIELSSATLPLLGLGDRMKPVGPSFLFSRIASFHEPPGYSIAELIGRPPSELRHAGHIWEMDRPFETGQTCHVDPWSIVKTVEKPGRNGNPLQFVTAERRFRTLAGEHVLSEQIVIAVVGAASLESARPDAPTERIIADPEPAVWSANWGAASPGDILTEVTSRPLRLTDLVRFAGAIGDFTPIHHDANEARAQGLPDVIAMGMLPCSLLAALVEQGFGHGGTRRFVIRFHNPLFAGVPVRLKVVAGETQADGLLAVEMSVTAGGAKIISGSGLGRPDL